MGRRNKETEEVSEYSNLEQVIREINKEYKSDIITYGVPKYDLPKIPLSSPRVNYMLYGGIPLRRVIELCGPDAGGKTTTALDIISNYQTLPNAKKVLYIDHECTLENYWATLLGVDVENMVLYQPELEGAEDVFEIMIRLIKTGAIGLVVLDSIGSLVPKKLIDNGMEQQVMGGIASVLTRVVNTVIPLLPKYDCTFIGINQVRDSMNAYNPYNTPGGKAWKHACSVRLMCSKGSLIDEDGNEISNNSENPAGNLVMIKALKLKGIRPNRLKGFYTLNYRTGIDYVLDTIDTAIKFELIEKTGGWYQLMDVDTGEMHAEKIQGLTKLRQYYMDNQEEFEKLYNKVNELVEVVE